MLRSCRYSAYSAWVIACGPVLGVAIMAPFKYGVWTMTRPVDNVMLGIMLRPLELKIDNVAGLGRADYASSIG